MTTGDKSVTEPVSEEDLADLVELYLEQTRTGHQKQSIEEFAAEHPASEQELLELLSAVQAVEKLGRSNAHKHHVAPTASFPETLGGYTLIEKIGRGGMGTVYKARQESLQREVAIKILAPSWSDDEEHCAAFEKEARLIAQLRHTNIVEIYGAGHEQGYRYYVMGLVRGKVLSPKGVREVYRGIAYERAIAKIGVQAAKALSFAHDHGILHRDIKPGNLMLDTEKTLHITDFGIATVLSDGEAAPLVTQSNDGTLRYMAPERLLHGKSSYATDQYALGLTLYELLQQKPAFQENEAGSLIRRICETPLSPLTDHGDLGAIVNKSIRFEPSERYPSMQAMLDDLNRYLNGEAIHAKAVSPLRRYNLWIRRKKAIALWVHIACLLVVALLSTAGIAYTRILNALNEADAERDRAQRNASIAGEAITSIIKNLTTSEQQAYDNEELDLPTKADIRLIQELIPYYSELLHQGAGDGKHLAQAGEAIAMIAMRAGDFKAAEEQLKAALAYYPKNSFQQIHLRNNLSFAMLLQRVPAKIKEAVALIQKNLELHDDSSLSFETRLELFNTLQLALRMQRGSGNRQNGNQASKRTPFFQMELLRAYAPLLEELIKQKPDNLELKLIQANLISELRQASLRKLFTPNNESAYDLITAVLEKDPDSLKAKRAYIHQTLHAKTPKRKPANQAVSRSNQEPTPPAPLDEQQPYKLEKAVRYAQELLATNPADTMLILQYLTTRLHYVNEIERDGDSFAAELEHERTLGVLDLILSRSDISPEARSQLLVLLSERPDDESIAAQRREWQQLMTTQDEKRLQNLRARMDNIKKKNERHRRRSPSRK